MIQTARTALGSFRVDEVNDVVRLGGYRLLWHALLPRTRNATFFQSLEWLEAYWRHFGDERRVRVMVLFSHGKPIGILPLEVRCEATEVGTVRVLTYPSDGWGTFYGPIGPDAAATLLGALRHVRNTRRDWDLLDLRPVDAKGCDGGRTPHAMRMVGFSFRGRPWKQTATIKIDRSWEQYWQSRSELWRRKVTQCERHLADAGRLEYVCHRPEGTAHGDGDPRWDLYDALEELAERQAAARSRSRVARTSEHPCERLRDVHEAAAHAGSVELDLLLLDGKPIAYLYHYRTEGWVCQVSAGAAPEHAHLEADAVLERRVLQGCFRRGDRVYEWQAGSADRAMHWQTSVATSYRYLHYPLGSPRTQLLRVKHWLDARFPRAAHLPSAG